jgi:large subunit ribosomal protein L10
MKLTKNEKIEKARALAESLQKAPHLFFTQFQGLKFGEIEELRAKLRPIRCRYGVVKNTLLRHALKSAGVEGSDPKLLNGPVA